MFLGLLLLLHIARSPRVTVILLALPVSDVRDGELAPHRCVVFMFIVLYLRHCVSMLRMRWTLCAS